MQVNFFRRRRILKNANFLDLVPVRMLGHTVRDDDGISLMMPRFRNRYAARILQPRRKDHFIHIRLDRFGSEVWKRIDGTSRVSQIIGGLCERFPAELLPGDDTNKRVTDFFSMLYQQRYISFREIMEKTAKEHNESVIKPLIIN